MAIHHEPSENKDVNQTSNDQEYFQQILGKYIKNLRKKAGFKSARDFAVAYNIGDSQYGYYESGKKDMRLSTLIRIFAIHNILIEDLFKINILSPENEDPKLLESIKKTSIEQAREQVKIQNGKEFADNLSDKDLERILKTLIFCIRPKSKKEILHELGLINTSNNFQRVTGFIQENEWIKKTNQENPNSPKQKYITTEKGRTIIQKSSI
ncbi:helix-turn-helix domain-containing protein [Anditalea andensis]|uniref:HTH cro/C1-type domain-containing protein n=1 Tax=Anditalea andensis TaxID=1048983 RepID=A0A074KW55_9BACT|nr:helix-turn-helix transcriptional regulator [Anditalea andensis]KEO71853.1 hypothetical protein EL17_21085 [Anditalea andensis]